MRSYFRAPLKIVDFFLSPENRVSAEARMRARMVESTFLFWAFFDVFSWVLGSQLPWEVKIRTIFYLVSNLFYVFLMKKSFSPEKVYLTASVIILILETLAFALSTPSNPLTLLISIYVLIGNCLVLSQLKMRIAFLCIGAIANIFAFLSFCFTNNRQIFESQSPADWLALNYVVSSTAVQFILIAMILKIKGLAQQDLDREIEWQERERRLGDIATMARSMRNLLGNPIEAFKQNLKKLKDDSDPTLIDRIQLEIDDLLLTSKSLDWIYRAHRGEESFSISSSAFMNQLEVLLSAKAQEGNWILNAEHRGQAIEIHGPIPAIMHLLHSIIFQILQAPQPSERRLSLVSDYDEDWTAWKISWPLYAPNLGLLQGDAGEAGIASQHELVQDLAQACNAKLKGFKSQGMQQLLITGFWRSLGATS